MPSTTLPPSTPKPLRFYAAVAVKNICLNDGIVRPDQPMFVAKWNELYVIAKNPENYFVVSEAQATEYVRTTRNAEGKLVPALNAPVLSPVGARFEWHVEAGTTCEDGCCGDESPTFTEKVTDKAAALALVERLENSRYKAARDFLRIRGPAFYSFKRPAPQPVPVVAPAVAVTAPRTSAPSSRSLGDTIRRTLSANELRATQAAREAHARQLSNVIRGTPVATPAPQPTPVTSPVPRTPTAPSVTATAPVRRTLGYTNPYINVYGEDERYSVWSPAHVNSALDRFLELRHPGMSTVEESDSIRDLLSEFQREYTAQPSVSAAPVITPPVRSPAQVPATPQRNTAPIQNRPRRR